MNFSNDAINFGQKLNAGYDRRPIKRFITRLSDMLVQLTMKRHESISFGESELRISGADFSNRVFENCVISAKELIDCNFSNSTFKNCIIKGDIIKGNFKGANFEKCSFGEGKNKITHTDFSKCYFNKCDFSNTLIENTSFRDANIAHSNFADKPGLNRVGGPVFSLDKLTKTPVDFTGANILNTEFAGNSIPVCFDNAILNQATFRGIDDSRGNKMLSLDSMGLSGTVMSNPRFIDTKLTTPPNSRLAVKDAGFYNCSNKEAFVESVKANLPVFNQLDATVENWADSRVMQLEAEFAEASNNDIELD